MSMNASVTAQSISQPRAASCHSDGDRAATTASASPAAASTANAGGLTS